MILEKLKKIITKKYSFSTRGSREAERDRENLQDGVAADASPTYAVDRVGRGRVRD